MTIHLQTPIGGTGYGLAGLHLLKALYKQNKDICLSTIGNPLVDNKEDAEIVNNAMFKQASVDYNAITVKIWHQFDLLNKPGRGKYLAYPFFEIDTFNDLEKHHLNFPDEIIVSSKWAKSIIEKNNINKPVKIVPLGVDMSIFYPRVPEDKEKINNYIFMTAGKWEIRKSHDIIIECFNRAFEQNDQVELWLATHNMFLTPEEEKEWNNLVQNSKLKSKIKVFPRMPSQIDLARLMSYSDCGIYVSRAEGWNLELLETMAMNKPIIATNYSAHTEYCNSENCTLIDIQDSEPAKDNKWFNGSGNWAKITDSQKEHLIWNMREMYKYQARENPAGLATAQKFSWENSANTLVRCIQE
jgi:glycosyltransferase involved in cell wall biosynthesis